MPVTIKLSRQSWDAFGEEITNELVDWFNQVDATYRLELREQNELDFARFDARLEQPLAEFKADLRIELHTELARLRADLIKWTFIFWATTALAVLGFVFP